MNFNRWALPVFVAVLTNMVACGGGGGGGGAEGASPVASLAGTAAVGAPLAGAEVTLKDANGKTLSVTADANGSFVFSDISGVVAPAMLKATGTAGGETYTLYSLASTLPDKGASGVVNVTPVTDGAVGQALGTLSPEDAFNSATAIKTIDLGKLAQVKTKLVEAVKEVLTALGNDASKVDLFATPFKADNTGLDKLLDLVTVQTLATATGSDIRLVDKSSGKALTLKATDTVVTPLPRPSNALVQLDTSTIKQLLVRFNGLTGSKADIQSEAMKDVIDPDFLAEGLNRTAFQKNLWVSETQNALNLKLLDYKIGACDASTKVCQVTATVQDTQGGKDTYPMPLKLGSDGKWRFYGDSSPFQFDLKPVFLADYAVSGGIGTIALSTAGVNLFVPIQAGLTSVSLSESNDSGATWIKSFGLRTKAACRVNYLVLDDGNPTNCSNLQAVTDEQARAANEKIDQGLRKFKIEGTDADGKKLSFEAPSRLPLFTQASAQAALSRKKLGIDFSQWGGQSVAFTGKPDYVEFSVTLGSASGTSSWVDEAVAILEGSASVLAANALCKQAPTAPVNSPAFPSCDQIYSVSTGSITRMFLSGRDPLGRGLWLTYRSSGSGGAPSIPSN